MLIPKFFDFQMIIANKLDRGVVYFFGCLGRTKSRFHDSAIENLGSSARRVGGSFSFLADSETRTRSRPRGGALRSLDESYFGATTATAEPATRGIEKPLHANHARWVELRRVPSKMHDRFWISATIIKGATTSGYGVREPGNA